MLVASRFKLYVTLVVPTHWCPASHCEFIVFLLPPLPESRHGLRQDRVREELPEQPHPQDDEEVPDGPKGSGSYRPQEVAEDHNYRLYALNLVCIGVIGRLLLQKYHH